MTILKNNGIRIKHAVIFLSPVKKNLTTFVKKIVNLRPKI